MPGGGKLEDHKKKKYKKTKMSNKSRGSFASE